MTVDKKKNYRSFTLNKKILSVEEEEIFVMDNYFTSTISPFASKEENTDKKVAPSQTEGQSTEKVSLSIFELPVEKMREIEEKREKEKSKKLR